MTRIGRSGRWLAALAVPTALTVNAAAAAELFAVPGQWTPQVEGLATTLK
jgi:hypothetical protein